MWRYTILGCLLLVLAGCTTGGTKMTSSWKDPELRQRVSGPVLVLARLPEPGARRWLEDQTAEELRRQGVQASPAYRVLKQLPADERISIGHHETSGTTTLVLYTMGNQYADMTKTPGVTPGVGIGPFGIGVGPVIGGAKPEQRSGLDVQVIPSGEVQPVWSAHYDVNLKEGLQKGLHDVPARAITQARTDGAL